MDALPDMMPSGLFRPAFSWVLYPSQLSRLCPDLCFLWLLPHSPQENGGEMDYEMQEETKVGAGVIKLSCVRLHISIHR